MRSTSGDVPDVRLPLEDTTLRNTHQSRATVSISMFGFNFRQNNCPDLRDVTGNSVETGSPHSRPRPANRARGILDIARRASRKPGMWGGGSSSPLIAGQTLARRGGARLLFLGFKPLAAHPDDRRYGRGVVCRLVGPLATRGVCESGICSKTRFKHLVCKNFAVSL